MRPFRGRFERGAAVDEPAAPERRDLDPAERAQRVLVEAAAEIARLGSAADRATARVEAVVEEEFGDLRREQRIDRERLVVELAGSLVERTQTLARQAHELESILDRAWVGLAGRDSSSDPSEARRRTAMRSLAAQLVDAGSTPAEVAAQLRRLFGVRDGSEIVDEVRAAGRGKRR